MRMLANSTYSKPFDAIQPEAQPLHRQQVSAISKYVGSSVATSSSLTMTLTLACEVIINAYYIQSITDTAVLYGPEDVAL